MILIYVFYGMLSVGNKNDCPSRKVVVTEDAQRFANQMNIPLFETSAKENINVEEMFLTITKMVSSVVVGKLMTLKYTLWKDKNIWQN